MKKKDAYSASGVDAIVKRLIVFIACLLFSHNFEPWPPYANDAQDPDDWHYIGLCARCGKMGKLHPKRHGGDWYW